MQATHDTGRQLALAGIPPPAEFPFATVNSREMRIIRALATRPRTREELDLIAGASNVPDAIAVLRRKGLEIPSCREPEQDCDGAVVYRGRYRFTDTDKRRTRGIWEGEP